MRPRLIVSLLVALPWLHARPALADDPVAQARQRFAAGRAAYGEGRYQDAATLFLQANALDPHAELLFNVAQAYEKLDDVPDALRVFREYLRLLPNAADRALVEEKDRKLEARLQSRGVQQVTITCGAVGAAVLLDGKPVGTSPWTGEVAPGRHVAVVKAAGYADAPSDFVLSPDHAMDVEVPLARPAPITTPPAPAPPAPPPDRPKIEVAPAPEAPARRVAPWTYAALGLGVVGLGGALGFEVARESAESKARSDPTQLGYRSAYDDMIFRQTASRVFLGVGAAATVAGGVSLALDLRRAGAPPARAGIGCFLGACGAVASGRF